MLLKLTTDASGIKKGLDSTEQILTKYGLKSREITKAMLATEELMTSFLAHAEQDVGTMHLCIRRRLGEISVEVSVPGSVYDFERSLEFGVPLDTDDISRDAEDTIRNIILRSFAADLKYRNRAGVNSVRLTVARSSNRRLYYTFVLMS